MQKVSQQSSLHDGAATSHHNMSLWRGKYNGEGVVQEYFPQDCKYVRKYFEHCALFNSMFSLSKAALY